MQGTLIRQHVPPFTTISVVSSASASRPPSRPRSLIGTGSRKTVVPSSAFLAQERGERER